MDFNGIISSIRLAHSVISERESTSDVRRDIFNAVSGQQISFTPEVGDEISIQVRNCAYDESDQVTYLIISITDPNRPADLFQLKRDFRYHYLNLFMRGSSEFGNPLVTEMNFFELGPQDLKLQFMIESNDPPTLQLTLGRVEKVMSQIHTEFQQFLRSMYEDHKDEFEVTTEYVNGKTMYEAETDLDPLEMVPQPGEYDFEVWSLEEDDDTESPIIIGRKIYDYVNYAVAADAGGDEFLSF